MPFGTDTPDDGTKPVPLTIFGIMGDPKTHVDKDKPNPMTPEVIEKATVLHEAAQENDFAQEDGTVEPSGSEKE
jgi:hypothetical protein